MRKRLDNRGRKPTQSYPTQPLPPCNKTLDLFPRSHDKGGPTGGERVKDSAQESNIIAVWCYDPIRWPNNGPIEPEVFWLHWLAVGDQYPDTEGGW